MWGEGRTNGLTGISFLGIFVCHANHRAERLFFFCSVGRETPGISLVEYYVSFYFHLIPYGFKTVCVCVVKSQLLTYGDLIGLSRQEAYRSGLPLLGSMFYPTVPWKSPIQKLSRADLAKLPKSDRIPLAWTTQLKFV